MKIAFFTEKLPPTYQGAAAWAYDWVQALVEQGHEVQLYSRFQKSAELPPAHSRIPILRPCLHWHNWEIPKVLPTLLQFQPDVVHFLQPTGLHWLVHLKAALGHPLWITSFYDLKPSDRRRFLPLLTSSDHITLNWQEQRALLQDFSFLLPKVEVVPWSRPQNRQLPSRILTPPPKPLPTLLVIQDRASALERERLLYDLIPILKICPEWQWVWVDTDLSAWDRQNLWRQAEQAGLGARLRLAYPTSDDDWHTLFQNTHMAWLANLAPSSARLQNSLQMALETSTFAILSPEQKHSLPSAWTAHPLFLTASVHSGLRRRELLLWISNWQELQKQREQLTPPITAALYDQPANLISRLYTRLAQQGSRQVP